MSILGLTSLASRYRSANTEGDRLYKGGYALVLNTLGTTAVGVAYWAFAANLYDRQAVGRASALVSALALVSSVAQLNLGSTLPRFLPLAARRSGRLIRYSYGANTLAALVVGTAFVTLLPLFNSQWRFLGNVPALCMAFVVAAVIWGIFALEDAALTGLRHTAVVPVENTIYGLVKLALLIAFAAALPATGIFVSWTVPLIVIVPVVNWLIFGRYLREEAHVDAVATVRPREVIRFASIDYIGAMLGQLYSNMLPLLVLSTLGATANGTFYIAWTITNGLNLVAMNFATSMLVEGTASPHRLGELTRGVLVRCAVILLPSVAVLMVAGHQILSIYGARYADQAAGILGWLALSVLPRGVIVVAFSLDRLSGRVGRATLTNLAVTALVLGGSWIMLTRVGIAGVALAWGGGNLVIALVRLPTIVRVIRGGRGREAVATRRAQGGRRASPGGRRVLARHPRHVGAHRRVPESSGTALASVAAQAGGIGGDGRPELEDDSAGSGDDLLPVD